MLAVRLTFVAIAAALSLSCVADETQSSHPSLPQIHRLPSLKEQASLINGWAETRKRMIPGLLRWFNVDAWLISSREYNEDPVFWVLKRAEQFSARRRTMHLFLANGSGDEPWEYSWVDNTDKIWDELAGVINERNLTKTVLNVDNEVAFSAGLSTGEGRTILSKMKGRLDGEEPVHERFGNMPGVAITYIAMQMEKRLPWYGKLQETAWAVIQEAFSEAVITPDVTTTEDVEWWMREKLQSLNYTTWFHPSVRILGPGNVIHSLEDQQNVKVITYGDVLHTDFGLTAMGMNTDTQHLGYVLHPGETEDDVPGYLLEGLRTANRLQDIVKENMIPRKTGNEILKAVRDQMNEEGLHGLIYSHPIGDFGHSAGALIGMTNLQEFVPGLGEANLTTPTWYSIELRADYYIPELRQWSQWPVEEDVYWNKETETFEWVYGRQERFHLVRTPLEAAGVGSGQRSELRL